MLGQAPVWVKLSAAYRSQSDQARAQAIEARLREACGGVGRFLWGSDWPNTQFESQTRYDQQFALLEALLPNPEERRRVLVDNPATLFGFASA
nr:amidohydrolase family protein [Pseudomonas sp. HS-2]